MMSTSAPAKVTLALAALALTFSAGILAGGAGPLNPPAGPVASSYKTLTEVEPRIAINVSNTPGDADSLFKITQPGSYYLTSNTTGVTGRHGIEISASNVTLDLNGFALVGSPGMGAFDAVVVTAVSITNVAILNGTVRGWGGAGINLGGLGADNCRVDSVLVTNNVGSGILAGTVAVVSGSNAYLNGGHGLLAGTGSTVSRCSASQNALHGFSLGSASTAQACSASLNGANGFAVGNACTVSDCSALQNTASGISTGSGCNITDCTSYNNDAVGIGTGVGSSVHQCTAHSNAESGFSVSNGSIVTSSTARSNTLDGILCGSQCQIRDNLCSSNGAGAGDGAGIHATGFDNRFEGNTCTGADRGIDLDSAGNLIVRNSCSGNTTNWAMVANNYYGPIIDRTAVATPAVNGPAAASTLASAEPNANFSY